MPTRLMWSKARNLWVFWDVPPDQPQMTGTFAEWQSIGDAIKTKTPRSFDGVAVEFTDHARWCVHLYSPASLPGAAPWRGQAFTESGAAGLLLEIRSMRFP